LQDLAYVVRVGPPPIAWYDADTTSTQRDVRMSQDKRQKRDLHALNADGMVLCNPRDKEAAHRAEMEGIATDDAAAVTCRKCLELLYTLTREQRES
jgi:hypothetical protein